MHTHVLHQDCMYSCLHRPSPPHLLSVELMSCCYSVLQSFISHIHTVYPAPLYPPHTLSFFPHPLSSTSKTNTQHTLRTYIILNSSPPPSDIILDLSYNFNNFLFFPFLSLHPYPPLPSCICVYPYTQPPMALCHSSTKVSQPPSRSRRSTQCGLRL